MAASSSVAVKSVFGSVRCVILSCTVDAAATAFVAPGVGYVFAAAIDPISMNTSTNRAPNVKINATESGTSLAGTIGVSGLVSGDAFYLTIYGRS